MYNRQPKKAPAFDTLVGKLLDIRWRYWTTEAGKRKGVNMWITGEVIEVADGRTTKSRPSASPRCRGAPCASSTIGRDSNTQSRTVTPSPVLLLKHTEPHRHSVTRAVVRTRPRLAGGPLTMSLLDVGPDGAGSIEEQQSTGDSVDRGAGRERGC